MYTVKQGKQQNATNFRDAQKGDGSRVFSISDNRPEMGRAIQLQQQMNSSSSDGTPESPATKSNKGITIKFTKGAKKKANLVKAPKEEPQSTPPQTIQQKRRDSQSGTTDQHTGNWVISDQSSVDLDHNGTTYSIEAPAEVHSANVSFFGNTLKGGYTVVTVQNGVVYDQTWYYNATFSPNSDQHSEGHFLDAVDIDVGAILNQANVIGVIIEIHQTNSPCAGCQRGLDNRIAALANGHNIPVKIRASATQIYESQAGRLGRGLFAAQGQNGLGGNDDDTMDMNENVTGMHIAIPPRRF